jgi:hypothetical protein
MALDKLEEAGYKPRKKPIRIENAKIEKEVENILKEVEKDETKKQIWNLLVEALSESNPREIIIYGMYVKKNLTPFVPAMREQKIEKTLEWLDAAIEQILKTKRE